MTARAVTATASFAAVAVTAALVQGPAPALAQEPCAGVSVVVDAREAGGGISVACLDTDPRSGLHALEQAGHHYAFLPNQPGFVCTIDRRPDPCNGAPADAYWSYWHAPAGGSWTYSSVGAGSRDPAPGEAEGWRFGDGSAPPGIAPPPLPPPEPDPEPEPDDGSTDAADPAPDQDPAGSDTGPSTQDDDASAPTASDRTEEDADAPIAAAADEPPDGAEDADISVDEPAADGTPPDPADAPNTDDAADPAPLDDPAAAAADGRTGRGPVMAAALLAIIGGLTGAGVLRRRRREG